MSGHVSAVTAVRLLAAGLLAATVSSAAAQTAQRDGIADLLAKGDSTTRLAQSQPKGATPGTPQAGDPAPKAAEAAKDPREGDLAYEQAQRLMKAIDAILQDAAKNRGEAKKLPPKATSS